MLSASQDFDARVQTHFHGREGILGDFRALLQTKQGPYAAWNVHGVTGTGKSFLLHRFLNLAQTAGLKTVKVQFDGKDREESVVLGQHHEILRHIAARLGVPTPRFATAYLAWSLSKELRGPGSTGGAPQMGAVVDTGIGALVEFILTSSVGPGGLMTAAAKAGWRFVAERVNAEPLTAFYRSAEGRAFAEGLMATRADAIPAELGRFLAEDLAAFLPSRTTGTLRAVVAFDSWEQFEERFPERRARWHEERQVLEFFQLCRDLVQVVIVSQRPITWLEDDRRLAADRDVRFVPLAGLDREEATGYLRDRRGFESASWIEAMLDATEEREDQGVTRHHALSLGMIADTAVDLLQLDPNAKADSLEVAPNDLEDLVRRFMSVREDREPMLERLSLTPRFDARCVALALGKPFDEFDAITDFEGVMRYAFIESSAGGWLTMHGLMRRAVRERMTRYHPAKIVAAHSAWRRHYAERGEEALAFRHGLGVSPGATREAWEAQLAEALKSGDARRHGDLAAWGAEIEDELPYLERGEAADLLFAWAKALRQSHGGEKHGHLSLARSLIGRALVLVSRDDDAPRWRRLMGERGANEATWYDLDGDPEIAEQAMATLRDAQSAYEPGPEWAALCLACGELERIRGWRAASSAHLEDAVAWCRRALDVVDRTRDADLWAEGQALLSYTYSCLGPMLGRRDDFVAAVEAGRLAQTVFTKENSPLRWADVQRKTGLTLRDWAELAGDPTNERLAQAFAALVECADVYGRQTMPLDWARLQLAIAYTLVEWGRREEGTGRLAHAVAVCDDCLQTLMKAMDPVTWSLVHGSRAKALRFQAEREADPALFAESVAGYREALTVRDRAAMASYWALAHLNLGDALLAWCQIEPEPDRLREAEACFRRALEVFTSDNHRANWERATTGLNEASRQIAESSTG
ncbi:MAG: hypothetical protein KIS66_08180 [Fimbriimonadaceae bacterium]|nr:hypothetical protein [Fimbriimonadaceae bacterium]